MVHLLHRLYGVDAPVADHILMVIITVKGQKLSITKCTVFLPVADFYLFLLYVL